MDLFNEIVSFEKNANGEYFNIWESKYGITMDELLPAFDYALQNKPEGVNFLYNEPFLENDERRKKVLEVLRKIDSKRPGLIDTLGSQMHITIGEDEDKIRRCFEDFRTLQERTGKHIQITEFDMSLGRTQIPRVFGNNPEVTLEQVYEYKHQKIGEISSIISESGVHLDGISYWSLADGIDCNLERVRSNYLADGRLVQQFALGLPIEELYSGRKQHAQSVKEESYLLASHADHFHHQKLSDPMYQSRVDE